MNLEKKREIPPSEWLSPPVNYALNPPKEILEANAQAANLMNKAKDRFIGQCLETLYPRQQVGEIELEHLNQPEKITETLLSNLNPSNLQMTIEPVYEKPLAKPQDPQLAKGQTIVRKSADLIQLRYCDRLLGTLSFEYDTGEIRIKAEVLQPDEAES